MIALTPTGAHNTVSTSLRFSKAESDVCRTRILRRIKRQWKTVAIWWGLSLTDIIALRLFAAHFLVRAHEEKLSSKDKCVLLVPFVPKDSNQPDWDEIAASCKILAALTELIGEDGCLRFVMNRLAAAFPELRKVNH